MTTQKFEHEIETLKVFLQTYCASKHTNQFPIKQNIPYKNFYFSTTLNLCSECFEIFEYSLDKLQNCPHEEKPRCRKCSTPCYEKTQWKQLAKIMRFSGVKLGLLKLKNKLFS